MAQLVGNISWIGTLGNLTAYKRKDSDKIILRSRKRPLSDEVKNGEKFEQVRLSNSEFGGRSKVSKSIMFSMGILKGLADYNIAGPLNAILRPIQVNDPINDKGKRSILLSRHANRLSGFNLNRKYTFDSIIRTPVSFTIDKDSLSAKVIIPELLRGLNLFIPNSYPLYSFCINIGLVPDFIFKDGKYEAVNEEGLLSSNFHYIESEWFPSIKGSKEMEFEIKLTEKNIPSSFTLLLGIGIRYATLGDAAVIEQVPYIGNAKIIGTMGVY